MDNTTRSRTRLFARNTRAAAATTGGSAATVTRGRRGDATVTRIAAAALAVASLAASSGCGGGGGSDGGGASASLGFTVNWEQTSPNDAALASPGATPRAFDTPIPNAVNAIRFIIRPEAGSACCVSVVRGSQAFIDRHIVLSNATPGETTIEVHGFPTEFAPADGVTTTCATLDGEGDPCDDDTDSDQVMPSFASDETPIDVVAGQRNVVDVDVYSVPFVFDLEPDDGDTVTDTTPLITFTVADANFDIELAQVVLFASDVPLVPDLRSAEQCRDDDPELPDCSDGGELDVQGLRMEFRAQSLPLGEIDLEIEAFNTAEPQRTATSRTSFNIESELTTTTITTTTTSTTVTTTSSSTTIETTTTTLPGVETFCLLFRVANEVDLVGLSYDVAYGSTGGDFTGSGENVSCQTLLDTDPQTTFASYNDEDGSELHAAIISGETFSGPVDLAVCQFEQVPPLNLNALDVQVTEATAPDLSSANATVVIEETPCAQ